MTRYPDRTGGYEYRCTECDAVIPDYQGVFWFTRNRERGDATVEVPYCPECRSESITVEEK